MAALYHCKMCGGELTLVPGSTVCTCEYCGTRQTVPSADNEKKMTLFARANRILRDCEFDKAAGVFEGIVADFPQEAEAYWGLALCKYGIEYVDDPATGKKVPTCHRSSFESVMDDSNYQQAVKNADTVAKEVYRAEGSQIEELRRDIIAVSSREEPYDIFICYKETDENGERTEDSVLAQDAYDALTEKGYRVFFSRITLEDKLGVEYEPYIFAALNSAKLMLAFGTDIDHYEAVWVKNEWSRFLQLIAKGEKKTLIPCYEGMKPEDMPKEFTRLQAQNMGKLGAMQDLLRGVEKVLRPDMVIIEKQPKKNSRLLLILLAAVIVVAFGTVKRMTSSNALLPSGISSEIVLAPIDPASGWNETGEIVNFPFKYNKDSNGYWPTYATLDTLFPNAMTFGATLTDLSSDQLLDYLKESNEYQNLEITEKVVGLDTRWKENVLKTRNASIFIWEFRAEQREGLGYVKSWNIVGYGVGKIQKDGNEYYMPIHRCDAEVWNSIDGMTENFR